MRNFYLHVIVFISGAAVLAAEILGAWILGPFYGVSLFLWSALITVTLAALSLGHAAGGRWADKNATRSRLCTLVAGAGAWLLLIPWIKQPLLVLTEALGLRFALLVSAFLLFAPPLTLLGMIWPYAIRLRASALSEVGRSVGSLYAATMVGGIASFLFVEFFLLPHLGVNRSILTIGAVLLITAMINFAANKKSKAATLITIVFLLLAALAVWKMPPALTNHNFAATAQSEFADLRVLDTDEGRHLLVNGEIKTIVDTTSWESHSPEVAVMDIPKYFFYMPGKMLLFGLGGGAVAKNYFRAGFSVDAVENDPVVIKLASQYFGLKAAEAKLFEIDGRQFLRANEKSYDIIIINAAGSSNFPLRLLTVEAFGLMAAHLDSAGILAVNVKTVGWDDIIVSAMAATLRQRFAETLALPIAEPPNQVGNVILLASNRKLELRRELERHYFDPDYRFGPKYQKVHAWDNSFVPQTQGAPVLTDDFNPLAVWLERINLATRKEQHAYFANKKLL
jgi:predicted membrane-bound spermidine synthase